MHHKESSKKNHHKVKKVAKAEMEAEEDSEMEEPLAHDKEEASTDSETLNKSSHSKKGPKDADSTDSTDALDKENKAQQPQNSHT